ncbi:MAG: polyprenyl synthetase family protein [Pyrinomonadaceae bacterium]
MNKENFLSVAETEDLWQYVARYKTPVEKSLRDFLPLAPPNIETEFNAAIEYALFPGGKRLRPILTLLGAGIVGGAAESVLPSAAAVEFIHSSSLIFDDLPAMDNAPERRGKPALHEKFGAGLAILAALGLLNAAYGLVFVNHYNLPERAMQAHAELVECVGAAGMVGGQSIDLAMAKAANSTDESLNDFSFESNRNLKTSALIRLALRVGAILAGADYAQLNSLSGFAALLGDAYQLGDDLLDLQEDEAIFETRKTLALNFGRETAEMRLKNLVAAARKILLDNFSPSPARSHLIQLTEYLAERKN